MARLTTDDFAEMLNKETEECNYYFACQLAKEIRPILPKIVGQLNPEARRIAEHYIENPSPNIEGR